MDRPDQIDLLLGQFRTGMSLPSRLAALHHLVMVIILYRSQKEMSGIRAPRLIAAMQAAKACWNRTDVQLEADTMGREHLSARGRGGKRSVAGLERRGGPVPAGIRIGGPYCVTVESFEEGAPWTGAGTRMAAAMSAGAGEIEHWSPGRRN
jgi:hypothetical protein